jgi:hypothetical protein
VALAKAAGISFALYDTVNFVLSNDLDCCAWGGGVAIDGRVYGATWEPPWGQEAGTYAHELGHSLGLPHSGWAYYAYDSPWDTMSARTSARSTTCGTYLSANSGAAATLRCSEPGDGYIAPYKDALGWIPAANIVTTSAASNVATVLEANALPLGSLAKMIRICLPEFACAGANAHYFTVEARVGGLGTLSQYDNGLAGDGVIIHEMVMDRPPIGGPCYFNQQSGWGVPIDATPGDYDSANCRYASGKALYNAQFSPGETYTNTTYRFRVSVGARSSTSFAVAVGSLSEFTLTVNRSGTGGGQVVSDPAGITCGSVCSAGFAAGTIVTLAPLPDSGSIFAGWDGEPACAAGIVTMSANRECTAIFSRRATLVPGQIEAEDYDAGGPGVGFFDTTPGNEGGAYRADDVDIKPSAEGGYAVGWFAAEEWLAYTVDVQNDGVYTFRARVGAALPDRTFHVEIDDVDVTGSIAVPEVPDWDQYRLVSVGGVQLRAGTHRLRMVMGPLDFMDLQWIAFVLSGTPVPGRIEAEEEIRRR